MHIFGNRLKLLCYLLIACAILSRVPYLTWPLRTEAWRETQTALSVWAFDKNNHISLFNYETPIFGPPWQVPMELPIFQIYAYGLKCLLHSTCDFACHLAGLSMFCLSAWLTRRLCLLLTGDATISLLAAVFYVISPYAHTFSTASLIEYCAVSCCLAYLLSLSYLLRTSQSLAMVLLTILLGVLAYTVKGTTMAGYIGVVLAMAAAKEWRNNKSAVCSEMITIAFAQSVTDLV